MNAPLTLFGMDTAGKSISFMQPTSLFQAHSLGKHMNELPVINREQPVRYLGVELICNVGFVKFLADLCLDAFNTRYLDGRVLKSAFQVFQHEDVLICS